MSYSTANLERARQTLKDALEASISDPFVRDTEEIFPAGGEVLSA